MREQSTTEGESSRVSHEHLRCAQIRPTFSLQFQFMWWFDGNAPNYCLCMTCCANSHTLSVVYKTFAFNHSFRIPGATVKSNELSNESLVILGSQDKQWGVVNKLSVRNQPNGLVSFDLLENFDRFVTR